MFLSQQHINRHHALAQRDLGDRHELHRTVLSAFPKQISADERVLFRLEIDRRRPCAIVLIQSQTLPNWGTSRRPNEPGYLLQPPETRAIQPQIKDGMCLLFRLQSNPTVKWDGKRHAIFDDDRLIEWLRRKGEAHGFAVDPRHVRIVKPGKAYGKRGRQTWHVVQFDGLLEVVGAEAFASALRDGIGSAKAFGCGLLSVPYPLAETVAEAYSPRAWG